MVKKFMHLLQKVVDGCSVPAHHLPMNNMAQMYAELAERGNSICNKICNAMVNEPYVIAGKKRFDTDLMKITKGTMITKCGAMGMQCIGVLSKPSLGIAIKLTSGFLFTAPPVAMAKLGLVTTKEQEDLSDHVEPPVYTLNQVQAGQIEAVI